ncbi:MAG TPA: hypothetical protein VL988_04580 [Solirubrobacteraceae bacterium]|nr:hypothetical protein [Solirubrobacteraceae bacterium]
MSLLAPARSGQCGRRLGFALLLLCSWLVPAAAVDAHAVPPGALVARAPQARCSKRAGASQRDCPRIVRRPRLLSLTAGRSISPVLVGGVYGVDAGRWVATHPERLSVEWVDRHGGRLAQGLVLTLSAGQAGETVAARICSHTQVAVSCVSLSLPEAVRSVASYLRASCGARRPEPPPYDPYYAMLSAPAIGHGWNPCRTDVYSIDTYGEPPLLEPGTSWEALVTQALAQASAATGIVFQRGPDYSEPPGTSTSPPAGTTMTIGFGPMPVGIAGQGGPGVSGPFANQGRVLLDSQASWHASDALVVLLHELGHALGLGHPVPPPAPAPLNEIMDSGNYAFTTYQPGDLCGLFEVTWQQPCAGAAFATAGQASQIAPGPGPVA